MRPVEVPVALGGVLADPQRARVSAREELSADARQRVGDDLALLGVLASVQDFVLDAALNDGFQLRSMFLAQG